MGGPISLVDRRKALEKAVLRAAADYYRACSERDGGNPLEMHAALTDAAFEYGKASRGDVPVGKSDASCDPEAPTATVLPLFGRRP